MDLTTAQLSGLEFEALPPKEWGGVKVKVWHARLPGRVAEWRGIGVDPGRNFGVAVINGHDIYVFSGEMPAEDAQWKYGIRAYDLMAQPTFYHGVGPAVVEGAAYKMPHGEANLAYIRMGFVLGLYYGGYEVNMVPPATIRKGSFGSGKKSGLEVWPNLGPHAADSLGAALFAVGLELGE